MTEQELLEIEKRCDEATGGPWRSFIEGRDHMSGSNFVQTAGNDIELHGATVADYDFVAAAKQDIPSLIQEIRRLKAAAE